MTSWLIDRSALVRLGESPDADLWANRIERVVAINTVTRREIGYSARSECDLARALNTPPIASMPVACLTPVIEDRAVQVQRLLAQRGHHRVPSVPDLVIAATAELTTRTVLHLDKDFELVAEIRGQPNERVALS